MTTEIEVIADNEKKIYWDDLTEMQVQLMLIVYASHLMIKCTKLKRIFDLAKPYVIIDDDDKYFRIAKESVDVVFVLLREYA